MLFSIVALASVAAGVSAHSLTLKNNCGNGVPVYVDINFPGSVSYNGPQPGTLGAGASTTLDIPAGWNSRVCHNPDGKNCWGTESMSEFNFDSGGLVYYDISNILGYTVAQKIEVGGCDTVTCTSVDCACDQAYPPGNTAGCGSKVDAPVRACGNQDLTITYCP